jgi:hypothetical protein
MSGAQVAFGRQLPTCFCPRCSASSHLLVALTISRPVFFRSQAVAMVARYAFFEQNVVQVFRAQRHAAGPAQHVPVRLQTVADRDALIEHEAIAVPLDFPRRHGFKVFQDAALEVIDLFNALPGRDSRSIFRSVCRRCRTWRSSCCGSAAFSWTTSRETRRRSLVPGSMAPSKVPMACFVGVAGVDDHHIGLGDEIVPVFGST